MKDFLIALQFLTRIPVLGQDAYQDTGLSPVWYPVVGLLIGSLLCLPLWLMSGVHVALQAATVLFMGVLVTGGLHLDGLADSADGWLGGFGDRHRTLEIMSDSHSGAAAVIVVPLLLIMKFAGLTVLAGAGWWLPVLLAPVAARTGIVALLVTTPCARPDGMAGQLARKLPRDIAFRSLLAVILALVVLMLWPGVIVLVVSVLVWWGLRQMMIARIGGFTGDTAGAQTEIVETAFIFTAAMLVSRL